MSLTPDQQRLQAIGLPMLAPPSPQDQEAFAEARIRKLMANPATRILILDDGNTSTPYRFAFSIGLPDRRWEIATVKGLRRNRTRPLIIVHLPNDVLHRDFKAIIGEAVKQSAALVTADVFARLWREQASAST